MPAYSFLEIIEKGTSSSWGHENGVQKQAEETTVAKTFGELLKFNPYHDSKGRFASANSATSFTWRVKDPSKQHLVDRAKEREKERNSGGAGAGDYEPKTPREKAIREVEDKIRNRDYEAAAVIDKDGNQVFFKTGAESYVQFSYLESKMMKDNTLTHNHPHNSMFSHEDVVCMVVNEMQEVRATNRLGITYSLSRGEGYRTQSGAEFARNYQKAFSNAVDRAKVDLDKRGFRDNLINGKITQADANAEFTRVIANILVTHCERTAHNYGMKFRVEKVSVSSNKSISLAKEEVSETMSNGIVLDRDTEAMVAASFEEWLKQSNITKSEPENESVSIIKMDEDRRLVFGWASVSIKVDGEQLEDLQKDIIDPEDLEGAAYEYVLNFRDTGEEHIPSLRKKGKLVESCVFTAEKQKAMGIPEGIIPTGWWVGFKITDDTAWARVKSGQYRMFSIEGRANRIPIEKKTVAVAKCFNEVMDEIEKFNPYHDSKGRFATADGATSFTWHTKDPNKQHWADWAKERERERTSAPGFNDPSKTTNNDPTTIAGVKRGAPMSREEADQGNANPNYSQGGGYYINCQSCVVTFEARMRGYDVQTLPNTRGSKLEQLSRMSNHAWLDPKTGEVPKVTRNESVTTAKKCKTWLENEMEPGARYTFGHSWKGRSRSGHIICADKDSDGNVRLFDPQSGKTMTGKDVDAYLGRIKYTTTVYGMKVSCAPRLLRVDNKTFNPEFANHIMEAKAS